MTTPCEQAPVIAVVADAVGSIRDQLDTHGTKLDRLSDSLSILATQKEQITGLRKDVNDHEIRIRVVEGMPAKILWAAVGGITSAIAIVVTGYILYLLGAG